MSKLKFTTHKDWLVAISIALMLFELFFQLPEFTLGHFKDSVVSIATLDGVDIASRVGFVYQSLIVFALFLLGSFLIQIFLLKRFVSNEGVDLLSISGLGFVLVYLFYALGAATAILLPFLSLMFVLILFFDIIFHKISKNSTVIIGEVVLHVFLSAFAITVVFRDFYWFISNPEIFNFNVFFGIISLLIFSAYLFVINKNKGFWIFDITQYIVFLILLFPLSLELFLILQNRDITLSLELIYLFLFLVIVAVFAIRQFLKKQSTTSFSVNPWVLTLFVVSVLAWGFYTPVVEQSRELFELANPANSLMRLWVFNEIPFVHFFSSHVLSEQLYGYLYALLNGYSATTDFIAYRFIDEALKFVFMLILFRKIFEREAFSYVFVLLFAYLSWILVDPFPLIVPIFIYAVYHQSSFKQFVYLFLLTAFLCVWKIEVGLSNLFSVVVIGALLYVKTPNLSKLKNATKLLLISIIIAVAGVVVAYLIEPNFFSHLEQALHYVRANQAHGNSVITVFTNRLAVLGYFVFPLLMVMVAIYFGFMIYKSDKISLVDIAILYFSLYYLMNLQRGFVRHGYIEGGDMFLNAYIYLIFGLLIYRYFQVKQNIVRFALFLFSFVGVVYLLKFPDPIDDKSLFEKAFVNFGITYNLNNNKEIHRNQSDTIFAQSTYSDFNKLLEMNLADNQTFIDLSNTPMLYFYSQRRVPSYFNQYMQNTINEKMQLLNLAELQTKDIPIVVFCHIPKNWFDATDAISNTLRYNLISQYIFENYHPTCMVNNLLIWAKNGSNLQIKKEWEIDSLKLLSPEYYNIKTLPFIAGKYGDKTWKTKNEFPIKMGDNHQSFTFPLIADKHQNFLSVRVNSQTDATSILKLFYGSQQYGTLGAFEFTINPKSENEYLIPLYSQYLWYSRVAEWGSFDGISDSVKIVNVKLCARENQDYK